MRLALSLIVTLMTIATTVEAKSKGREFDGRLITYQQFMLLTQPKRIQYLKDLRKILVLMEKTQSRYEVASNDGSMYQLKEQIASFLKMAEFLPAASAEEGPQPVTPPLPLGQRANVPVFSPGTGAWECLAPGHQFDPQLGTCVLTNTGTTGRERLVDHTDPCPSSHIVIPNAGMPTRRCVPLESFQALSRARRKAIASGSPEGRLPSNYFEGENAEFGRQFTHGGGVYDDNGIKTQGTKPGDGTAVTQGPPAPPADPPVIPPAGPPAATPGDVSGPAAAAPVAPAAPAAPVAPAPSTCKFEALSCQELNPRQRQSLIDRFRKDRNANMCVAGGYFTSKNQRPQRGKGSCELVTEFKSSATAAPKKCGKEKDASGVMRDTAMCNPAVFCVGLKINAQARNKMKADMTAANGPRRQAALAEKQKQLGRALTPAEIDEVTGGLVDAQLKSVEGSTENIQTLTYCAPKSQTMTKSCDSILKDHLEGRRGVPGYTGPGFEYTQCDPSKIKGFALQNEWDDLAKKTLDQYKAICKGATTNANFRALFCEECNVIGERIFAANQRAVGTGCSDASPAPAARPAPGSSEPAEAIREEDAI